MTATYSNLGPSAPVDNAATITPDDGTDLSQPTRGMYVGGAGNLAVHMRGGTVATFDNLEGGQCYPFRIKRVLATGTTATGLMALYD